VRIKKRAMKGHCIFTLQQDKMLAALCEEWKFSSIC
jgi:hypothetical protein